VRLASPWPPSSGPVVGTCPGLQRATVGKFHDVWLDRAGNLGSFRPLGIRGETEYTCVDLSRKGEAGDTFGDRTCTKGLHEMRSDGPLPQPSGVGAGPPATRIREAWPIASSSTRRSSPSTERPRERTT